MEKNKKKYGLLVAVALCVCLLGGFLANLAQTDFGKVTKKTILFESNTGQEKKIHYRQLYGRMEEMQIKNEVIIFRLNGRGEDT